MTVALVAAVLLSAVSLFPLTSDRGYLWLTFGLTSASAVLTAAARRLRLKEALVRVLVLVPGAVVLFALRSRLDEIVRETTEHVASAYAPMEPHAGFRLLSALVLWLLFVVVESVAVALDRPGWTFPVLALPFLVPSIVLPDETPVGYLILAAVGYVIVLTTAVYNRFVTTGPAADGSGKRAGPPRGLRRGLGLAGVASLLIAWVLTGATSSLIPERSTAFLDPRQINSTVQLGDPSLDLVRNLRAPIDRTIITYRSDDGRGRYLRLAALPALDARGFHLVATDLMPRPLPDPPGLETTPGSVRLDVEVRDFTSEWLPVPWVPRDIRADGDWRYDPRSLAVVAVGDNRKVATRFLTFSVTSWDIEPSPAEVALATAGDPGDEGLSLALPPELDPQVVELARELTASAATDGEALLTLLGWLRSGPFTYSTDEVAGTTMETVSDFLLTSRTGYCEQFSGGLAILARAINIPSRVVVGFLPGVDRGGGTFDVSVRDMHAWTEVYLEGFGWVAFDPTPSGAPGVAPVPTPTAPPSAAPEPTPEVSEAPVPTAATSRPPTPSAPTGSPNLTAWAAAGLAALAVVAAPGLVRRGRSWWRLRPDRDPARMAEDAWDELRDSVIDSGHPWPSGTPRQTARALAGLLDPEAAAAAAALAVEVERARFAPAMGDADVVGQARTAAAGLATTRSGNAPPWRRVFPRSVVRRRH